MQGRRAVENVIGRTLECALERRVLPSHPKEEAIVSHYLTNTASMEELDRVAARLRLPSASALPVQLARRMDLSRPTYLLLFRVCSGDPGRFERFCARFRYLPQLAHAPFRRALREQLLLLN